MGFIDNLNWRYATKKFDGRKVPADILDKILEAIRMSPSSFGIQPYHITVVEDEGLKKELRAHAWDQEQLTSCPHLLIFSADTDTDKRVDDYLKVAAAIKRKDVTEDPTFDYSKEVKDFARKAGPEWPTKQAYIALGFAMAACAELRIDSCPMEGFDSAAFKKILNLPANLEPKVLLAVGYRSPEDAHAKLPKIRFKKTDLFNL